MEQNNTISVLDFMGKADGYMKRLFAKDTGASEEDIETLKKFFGRGGRRQ